MDQRTLTDLAERAQEQYGASHILTELALAIAQLNAEAQAARQQPVRDAILKFEATRKR